MSRPSHYRSRFQASIAALLALGLWLWLRTTFTAGVLILTVVLAAMGWFAPNWHAPVQRVLEGSGRCLAMAISWLLLGAVFVGLFVPLRIFHAITGRDALALRRPVANRQAADTAASYLRPLPSPRPRRFERMY